MTEQERDKLQEEDRKDANILAIARMIADTAASLMMVPGSSPSAKVCCDEAEEIVVHSIAKARALVSP